MEKPKGSRIIQGDCIEVMREFPDASIDFICTDPPYVVKYKDRSQRSIANDDNADWIRPAFAEMYRVLKPNSFCLSFYGFTKIELFCDAWKAAGFHKYEHFTFTKRYSSSVGYVRRQHENAFLLAKGRPPQPKDPPGDVIEWQHSGNPLHPTQKPFSALIPIIEAYSRKKDVVLDPFCGSGTTCCAAKVLGRRWLGIELSTEYHRIAQARIGDYQPDF